MLYIRKKHYGFHEKFECSTDNISLHLKHIFQDNELNKDSVSEKCSLTADDIFKRKGLRYREDILDNMNEDELVANLFRIN